MAPKEDPKELERQRLEREAKERAAKEEMERRLGRTPSGDKPEFPLWKRIADQFTDIRTQKTDWAKLGLVGLGALLGGSVAAGGGIIGMVVGAVAGSAILGTAGVFLMDWIRGTNTIDASKLPPPPLDAAETPDPNKKVVGPQKIRLPEVKPMGLGEDNVTIPTYNSKENIRAKATHEDLERLRAIVKDGTPDSRVTNDSTNWMSREMFAELQRDVILRETNLRYVRDEMVKGLKEPTEKTNAYLQKFGPEAAAALSVDVTPMLNKQGIAKLDDVPGIKGNLSPELEKYGRAIKERLIKEMADMRVTSPESLSRDDLKTIDTTWDNLSVIGKRNLVRAFADRAIHQTLTNRTDYREFFPEDETNIERLFETSGATKYLKDTAGVEAKGAGMYFNYKALNPLRLVTNFTLQDDFLSAYVNHDGKGMAEALKQRLAQDDADQKDESKKGSIRLLTPDARRKMQMYIMGFEAYEKQGEIETYFRDVVVGHDAPLLDKFAVAMNAHAKQVGRTQHRLESFAKSGGQFLVVDEQQPTPGTSTFKVVDVRSGTPKTMTIEVAYDGAPEDGAQRTVASLKVDGADKTKDAKGLKFSGNDLARFTELQTLLTRSEMTGTGTATTKADVSAAAPDLRNLLDAERNTMAANVSGMPAGSGEAWRLPSTNPDPSAPAPKR